MNMWQYIFELKWPVSDDKKIVIVHSENQRKAFDKLVKKYPNCPNVDFVGIVVEEIN